MTKKYQGRSGGRGARTSDQGDKRNKYYGLFVSALRNIGDGSKSVLFNSLRNSWNSYPTIGRLVRH